MQRSACAPLLFLALVLPTLSVGCVDVQGAPEPEIAAHATPAAESEGLSYYDEVPFTQAEAEAVLVFVNSATWAELDEGARLDHRAAESIVGARPIASMDVLSSLYFVGPVALKQLKAVALPFAQGFGTASGVGSDEA